MKGWAVFLFLFLASCRFAPKGVDRVTIKGSDTEVNLALALSEAYMARDSLVSIAVTGGGSGMGIAALINGKTDIANASRPFSPEELRLAENRGIVPMPIIFAVDALAVIVHGSLPVECLTLDQLSRIFSGDITHWQEVGGPELPISLYGRQSNSGTFVYFRDSIVQEDYARSLKQMNGTAQMVEAIKKDKAGIGYVGLGYILDPDSNPAEGLKALCVQREAGEPSYSPLAFENIMADRYPIIRPLYQYTDGLPSGKVLDFIRFSLSSEGQAIVQDNGYYPVLRRYERLNAKVLGALLATGY